MVMTRGRSGLWCCAAVCLGLAAWMSASQVSGSADPAAASEPPQRVRTYRTTEGKSIRARAIALDQTHVVLESPNGQKTTLAIDDLSETDRKYLLSLQGQLPAPASAPGGAPAPGPAATPAPQTAASGGEDWYQWRGPNRDGVCRETGLNDDWPDQGPPLVWRTRGLGSGYSSVSLSKGRLYTMGKQGNDTYLICRRVEDGREVWRTAVGGGDSPNCTPTVDPEANLVFGLSHGGDLLCADAETGREVWRKNFGRDFGGRMMSGWGYSESPLVDGDRLICTPGGDRALLAALDKRTGRQIWATAAPAGSLGSAGKDGAAYSSIVVSHAGGIKQYVQLVGRGVVGVAADDGRGLWNYNRIANGTANVPTPIVSGDYVFTSTGYGDGGTALLELSRQGRGISVREVYYRRAEELQNHHGGMVLVGNHVYLGHGHNNGFPACVELKTGRNLWQRTRGAGSGSAAVLYADGDLYFRYEDGVLALIEANPAGYRLKRSFQIAANNGKSWPHPVISGGRLYLRDQDELLCYALK